MLGRLLLGALATTTALIGRASADCSNAPAAHVWKIGDTESDKKSDYVPFCSTQWEAGVPVTGLDVWYDEGDGINAIQISYANGDKHGPFGVPGSSPQHQSIDWEYSKTFIDSLSLWGNGGGKQLGNIRMVLTDGREFDVGNRHDKRSKKTEFPIDVGAGVMLGAGGYGTSNIKQAFFLFLKSRIDKIEMTEPKFDDSVENLNAQQKGIQLQSLDNDDHANDDTETNTWTWAKTLRRKTTTSTTSSVTKTFGTAISMTWKASILAFSASTTVGLSYEQKSTTENTQTQETEVELSWSVETPVKPGTHVYCQATAMMGQSDLGYEATINVLLKDGSSWSWREKGVYSQVAWSRASSKCQGRPFGGAGANETEIDDGKGGDGGKDGDDKDESDDGKDVDDGKTGDDGKQSESGSKGDEKPEDEDPEDEEPEDEEPEEEEPEDEEPEEEEPEEEEPEDEEPEEEEPEEEEPEEEEPEEEEPEEEEPEEEEPEEEEPEEEEPEDKEPEDEEPEDEETGDEDPEDEETGDEDPEDEEPAKEPKDKEPEDEEPEEEDPEDEDLDTEDTEDETPEDGEADEKVPEDEEPEDAPEDEEPEDATPEADKSKDEEVKAEPLDEGKETEVKTQPKKKENKIKFKKPKTGKRELKWTA